jgi:hypothetical protein
MFHALSFENKTFDKLKLLEIRSFFKKKMIGIYLPYKSIVNFLIHNMHLYNYGLSCQLCMPHIRYKFIDRTCK